MSCQGASSPQEQAVKNSVRHVSDTNGTDLIRRKRNRMLHDGRARKC